MSNRHLLVQQLSDNRPDPVRLRQGVVDTVDAGSATVDVTVGGSSTVITDVNYLDSYTPTAGDTVWILSNGPDLLVIGKQET